MEGTKLHQTNPMTMSESDEPSDLLTYLYLYGEDLSSATVMPDPIEKATTLQQVVDTQQNLKEMVQTRTKLLTEQFDTMKQMAIDRKMPKLQDAMNRLRLVEKEPAKMGKIAEDLLPQIKDLKRRERAEFRESLIDLKPATVEIAPEEGLPSKVRNAPVLKELGSLEGRALVSAAVRGLKGSLRGTRISHLQDYEKLIPRTPELFDAPTRWFTDEYFVETRLLGPNAYLVQVASGKIPGFTDQQLAMINSKMNVNIAQLMQREELLVVNLSDLSTVTDVPKDRFLCAPVLLMSARSKSGEIFDLTKRTLPTPLAIKLNPNDQHFFMPMNTNWFLAKLYFNNADMNYHEAVSHLLNTHLNMEAYEVATLKAFQSDHPLFKLLYPHFLFTMTINSVARNTLTNQGGAFDTFFSLGLSGLNQLMKQDWSRGDTPLNFCMRVPLTKHQLLNRIGGSPYVYWGNMHYHLIHDYVDGYFKCFPKEFNNPTADKKIVEWLQTVKGSANIKLHKHVGHDRASLVDLVTGIIWTASVFHSAVNFGQDRFFSFIPAAPAILVKPPPTDPDAPPAGVDPSRWKNVLNSSPNAEQEKWLLQALPNAKQATRQIMVAHILSTPTRRALGYPLMEYFFGEKKKVQANLEVYVGNLRVKSYEDGLSERSQMIGYPYLIYDRVAQSVAI